MKHLLVFSLLVVGVLCAGPAVAQDVQPPQFAIFVEIDGISGSSLDEQHKAWIDAWSITQVMNQGDPKSACGLEFTKGLDKAGPKLWAAAVLGKHFKQAQVDVVNWLGDSQVKVYQIRLEEVLVTAIKTHGNTPFLERVQLAAGRVELKYFIQGPDGAPAGQVTDYWDCLKGFPSQGR